MKLIVKVNRLGQLISDLGRCYMEPVSLEFSDVQYKRGKPVSFTITITDAQAIRIRGKISDEMLRDRYQQ